MATNDPPLFPPDEANPYAPPASDLEPELVRLDLQPVELSIGDVLSRSWEIYRDRMGICIAVTIGCNAINYAGNLGLQIGVGLASMAKSQLVTILIMVVAFVALFALQLWLSIGQVLVLVDVARGRNTSFNRVFQGGRYILPVLAASMLLCVALGTMLALTAVPGVLAWLILGKDSLAGPIVLGVGLTAGVVVTCILGLRYSQFNYLIIDRRDGIIDSLRDSMKITQGNAAMLFVIYLLTGLINLGGFLACFIGMIFTLPFTALMVAVAYLALTGQAIADPYAKGEPLPDLEPL
jgi:uncharacterized membrane protein